MQQQNIDPKIPTIKGTSLAEFEVYEQICIAWANGHADSEKKLLGSRLYRNLQQPVLGYVKDYDLEKLKVEDGVKVLITHLKETIFREGRLRALPRVMKKYFRETWFRGTGDEPMARYVADKPAPRANSR